MEVLVILNSTDLNFKANIEFSKKIISPTRAKKLERLFAKNTERIKDYTVFVGNILDSKLPECDVVIFNKKSGVERCFRLKNNLKETLKAKDNVEIVKAFKRFLQLIKKEEELNGYVFKRYDEMSQKLGFEVYEGMESALTKLNSKSELDRQIKLRRYGIFEGMKVV